MSLKLLRVVETKIGRMYVEFDKTRGNVVYVLDSNKNYMGEIYCEYALTERGAKLTKKNCCDYAIECLKPISDAYDLAQIGVFSGCYFADSLEGLLEVINDRLIENEEEPMTLDFLKQWEWLNQVGNTYICVYENEYTFD